jgi:hypothetical protein
MGGTWATPDRNSVGGRDHCIGAACGWNRDSWRGRQ